VVKPEERKIALIYSWEDYCSWAEISFAPLDCRQALRQGVTRIRLPAEEVAADLFHSTVVAIM
jgi:hypothetical protein